MNPADPPRAPSQRPVGSSRARYDAVIVGAGPNGLSAACALARAGLSTLTIEARSTAGGGARTEELTLPGYAHDVCSTVHPLGAASPWFAELELERHGLCWVHPPAALAHVLGDGRVVMLERSIDATAAQFGADAAPYRALFEPLVRRSAELFPMLLGPLRLPAKPLLYAQFGIQALRSMRGLAREFVDPGARALLAGIAAHSMVPLEALATASFALVLGIAGHAVGWPIAERGSRGIVDALLSCLRAAGGELQLNTPIAHISELPAARAYLFDLTPRQLVRIAGDRLPDGYRRRLERYRHGPGVFKMDWALAGPIPWRDPSCLRAATVHLSGDFNQIAAAEAAVHRNTSGERPFVLVVQPSLFDRSRAPADRQIAWAYCHVPHGSTEDRSGAIEAEIERYAPGFRDLILARAARNPADLERYNPNNVGGDIAGGLTDIRQLFFRPVARIDPYSTPAPDIFVCSAATPPGGGVHGMCGYFAARSALSRVFGRS